MKKYVLIPLAIIIALSSVSSVYALQKGNGREGVGESENELQAQNREQDDLIEVDEDERIATKEASPRSERAREHMNEVAKQVEILLMARTTKGGIGEEVREIARNQRQTQNQLTEEVNRMDSRKGILKSFIGPDYQAIKNLEKMIETNQSRIALLEELKIGLTDKGSITQIEDAIQALTQQNVSLQERLAFEQQSSGLFGWLFRLFAR